MEIIRGTHNIQPAQHGCVLAIGNFDGVHLGHQQLLHHLCEQAEALGLPSTLIIFEPQPLEYFKPDESPPRLSRFHEKIALINKHSKLDRVLCLPFNANLAARTASDITSKLLIEQLKAVYILVGDDFHFGYGRQGNVETLQAAAKHSNFQVEHLNSVLHNGHRVSSSLVRKRLMNGDLAGAEELLGHPYTLSGRVVTGRKLGQTIGVPTANIQFRRFVPPLKGVYAVAVKTGARQCVGIANLGTKPTVSGERLLLEVNLFDFQGDLYGHKLEVRFLRKVRDEQRFKDFGALKEQINADIQTVRHWHQQGEINE